MNISLPPRRETLIRQKVESGFYESFSQIIEEALEHPEIGLERDELHAGVRSVLFHRYVVFYRSRGDSVEVLRVMSATRDVTPGVPA